MKNNKISKQGSKIMKRAKDIRKESPRKKWQDCVKQAAKQLKKENKF